MYSNKINLKVVTLLIILFIIQPVSLSSGFFRGGFELQNSTNEFNLDIKWSDKEKISAIESSQSYYPNIAIDSNNNLHVVWHESSSPTTIYYACHINRKNEWMEPLQISNAAEGNAQYPVLTLDERDNIHVLWRQTGPKLVYRSKIEGLWSNVTEIANCNTIVRSHDIIVDKNQNIHLVWSDKWNPYNHNLYHKIYDFNSKNWLPTSQLTTNSTYESFYPNLAIDSLNRIHMVWTDLNESCLQSEVFYKYYTSGNWYSEEPMIISSIDENAVSQPLISISKTDDIHFVWVEHSTPKFLIYYTKLENGLLDLPVILNNYTASDPDICCDKSGNTHLIWVESNAINYKKLNSYGKWSKTIIQNNTYSSPILSAKLSVSTKGTIHIIWNDYTTDYSWEIYHSEGSQLNYYSIIISIGVSTILISSIVILYFLRKSKKYKKSNISES